MTATAERLLAEIKTLPPSDINELCESVAHLANSVTVATRPPQDKALHAIRASYGLFAGAGLTQKLLEERAIERAREEAAAELHRTRRG
jgi:hypothetical protein